MPRHKMNAYDVSELMNEMSCAGLLKEIPIDIVNQELEACGVQSERNRCLPAASLIYLVAMMALNSNVSISENLRVLLEPLRRILGIRNSKIVGGPAISQARQKIGATAFRQVFEKVCKVRSSSDVKDCFWRNYRLVAVDGTVLSLQDTKANEAFFGKHVNQYGAMNYPQLRAVTLMECGSKIFFEANIGRSEQSEQALFEPLVKQIESNMLLLADRLYYGFDLWRRCASRGGALVWRVKKSLNIKKNKDLGDGSFLGEVKPGWELIAKGIYKRRDRELVRVIDYKPIFEGGNEGEPVRLLTNILDANIPAEEIAALYPARWTIEEGYSELKSQIHGDRKTLRSQLPELVLQEFYGFLLAHFATRVMMLEAAKQNNISPHELSFSHSVSVIRRKMSFFPSRKNKKGKRAISSGDY